MGDATERAIDVIDSAVADAYDPYHGWITEPGDAIFAAFMADPDLLVDLAIEAGGLTPDTVFESVVDADGNRTMRRVVDRG